MADEVAGNRQAINEAMPHHEFLRGRLQGIGLEVAGFDLAARSIPLGDPAGMSEALNDLINYQRDLLEKYGAFDALHEEVYGPYP